VNDWHDIDEVRAVWPYSPPGVLPVWRLLWAAEDALTEGTEDRAVHPRVVVRLRRLRNRLYWAGCWESGQRLKLPDDDEMFDALNELHGVLQAEASAHEVAPAIVARCKTTARALQGARARWDAFQLESGGGGAP
jgi:hypothetical protein